MTRGNPNRARRGARRRVALVAALSGALIGPAPALATPAEPTPAEPTPAEDRAAFDALVEAARAARAEGRLDDALAALRRAYALSESPAVLNNVGVLLEELGRYDEALAALRELASHPALPPDRKAGVDTRVAALEARVARGWLRLRVDPGAVVRVRDEVVDASAEIPLDAGRSRLAVFDRARRVGVQIVVTAVRGRRLDLDLTEAAARVHLGAYDVSGLGRPEVSLDRRLWPLVGPDAVRRLYVDPGERLVGLSGGEIRRVAVAAGEVLTLDAGPPSGEHLIVPGVLGGVGLISLGVGAGLFVDAEAERDDLRAALSGDGPVDGLSRDRALDRQRAADDEARSGAILLGAGAALMTGALLWWAIADDGGPTLEVHGGRAAWTVRW